MGEQRNSDYLDEDWGALVANRSKKWEGMLREFERRGMKKLPLWEKQEYPVVHPKNFEPGLIVYPSHKGEKRGMLIICPGGGFAFKSSNEGKEVAEYFYEKGLNVAILDYAVGGQIQGSTGPVSDQDILKAACEDAKRAVRLVRYYADTWNIRKDKIGIGGFSAGGMVTSQLLLHFDRGNARHEDPIEQVSCRPDATFQMYGSFRNNPAFTSQVSSGLGFDFSAVHKVSETDVILRLPLDIPPMYMAQTDEDNPVSILDMGRAYYERGVPFEIHLFHGGPHGCALFDGKHENSPYFPHTAHWAELASEWFVMQGF